MWGLGKFQYEVGDLGGNLNLSWVIRVIWVIRHLYVLLPSVEASYRWVDWLKFYEKWFLVFFYCILKNLHFVQKDGLSIVVKTKKNNFCSADEDTSFMHTANNYHSGLGSDKHVSFPFSCLCGGILCSNLILLYLVTQKDEPEQEKLPESVKFELEYSIQRIEIIPRISKCQPIYVTSNLCYNFNNLKTLDAILA